MADNYVLNFEDVRQDSLESFIKKLKNIEGKKLSDLKIKDLTYQNDELINPGHGVYVFRDDNRNIILVGKATSTSFTERIAKHLDIRPFAWFNRLMFVICCRHLNLEQNETNYKLASEYAFQHVDLVLVNFKIRSEISGIEKTLRGSTETLNKYRVKRFNDLDKCISDYCD